MEASADRSTSGTTRILILGGGFGGVHAARGLERPLKGGRGVIVTLANRANFFLFYPPLSEAAGGTIEAHHIVTPLRRLLRRTRVQIGEIEAIDLDARTVSIGQGLVR